MSIAEKGRRYRHYKKETMVYTVVEIALDCETVEPLVVYRSEYETPGHPKGTLWVRRKADFESTVTLPDGRYNGTAFVRYFFTFREKISHRLV